MAKLIVLTMLLINPIRHGGAVSGGEAEVVMVQGESEKEGMMRGRGGEDQVLELGRLLGHVGLHQGGLDVQHCCIGRRQGEVVGEDQQVLGLEVKVADRPVLQGSVPVQVSRLGDHHLPHWGTSWSAIVDEPSICGKGAAHY